MTSEDVIHSFFVPQFRIKQDVLPGRYTQTWFQATMPGTFHLFCTQLCGTEHARMVGDVVAMTPDDYARWSAAQPEADDIAKEGEKLFRALGCSGCHALGVDRPCAAARRPLRQAGPSDRRPDRGGRRRLHPRLRSCSRPATSWTATPTSCRAFPA